MGGRHADRITLGLTPFGSALACAIAFRVGQSGRSVIYTIGGLPPPLGIALRADGISAVMLVATAAILTAAAFYAREKFAVRDGTRESRSALTFWIMMQAIWAALTIVFVGSDLFNLYVALELLTFAAVPLVCIDGRPETLAAALRYLLFALFGSISYLLGVALFYGAHGTLDIPLLAHRVQPTPVVWTAAALMTGGLLAKTALFPLHLWLPPAHANAPAAASAVLSGLVVKGSFFLMLRLWFYVLPALPTGQVARGSRRARLSCRRRGRCAGLEAATSQAADRLFDRVADRLPFPDISSCRRHTGVEHDRLERRTDAGSCPCLRQGSDVSCRGRSRRNDRP